MQRHASHLRKVDITIESYPTLKGVVRLLLQHPETDWNVKDSFGSTAYCDAVQMGHTEIQEMFEEMDKDVGKLSERQCVKIPPPIINEEQWRRKLSTFKSRSVKSTSSEAVQRNAPIAAPAVPPLTALLPAIPSIPAILPALPWGMFNYN